MNIQIDIQWVQLPLHKIYAEEHRRLMDLG